MLTTAGYSFSRRCCALLPACLPRAPICAFSSAQRMIDRLLVEWPQPEASYRWTGHPSGGSSGRADDSLSYAGQTEGSPGKRKVLHVVAGQGSAEQAQAPSLVVNGVAGSGAGALSLAAGTTRSQLCYHYDINMPSIEDEAYETAVLAGRAGASIPMPMPQHERPEPSAYEPIYRYPVDTGGDATFDLPGFVARAQVLHFFCNF